MKIVSAHEVLSVVQERDQKMLQKMKEAVNQWLKSNAKEVQMDKQTGFYTAEIPLGVTEESTSVAARTELLEWAAEGWKGVNFVVREESVSDYRGMDSWEEDRLYLKLTHVL